RFPKLLAVLEQVPAVLPLFAQLSVQVPSWTLLRWVAQMMPLLARADRMRECVLPLLTDLARSYPQGLYYPFRISTEDFSEAQMRAQAPRSAVLNNRLMDLFVATLHKLPQPERRCRAYLDDLKSAFSRKGVATVKLLARRMWDGGFDPAQQNFGEYGE